VKPQRIVVIGLRRLLREIVLETIRSAPDLDVVRDYPERVDLRDVIRSDHPGVIVADTDALAMAEVEQALRDTPDLTLVALHDDARQLLLYELAPRRIALGEASPQRLLDAIRGKLHGTHSSQSAQATPT
jgi:chemotaxis response regulator CheB